MWEQALRALHRRIMLVVGRCVLSSVNDDPLAQEAQIQLLDDEVRDQVERYQEYGFTSVPHAGAEGVAVFVGGDRGHGIVIAVEDRKYRLTGLADGEVAIYTDEGDKVHFKRGNVVYVQAGTKLVLDTPLVEATGVIRAANDIIDMAGSGGQSMKSMRAIYDTHDHDENDDQPNPTDDPNQLMVSGGDAADEAVLADNLAAVAESQDVSAQDSLLMCIPDIADAEASAASEPDVTGWAQCATFLRKWFAGAPSTDKSLRPGSLVEWDWLLQYYRVQLAWDNLADPEYLFSENAKAALVNVLQTRGYFDGSGDEFDFTVGEIEDLHAGHHQHVSVLIYNGDGLDACMGRFTIFALASGKTSVVSGVWSIAVTGMSFYVRDNFDFEDDTEDSQGLGYWDCEEKEFEWGSTVVTDNVYNADFRAFREQHHIGGDFYVYAMPRPVDDFQEYVYEV